MLIIKHQNNTQIEFKFNRYKDRHIQIDIDNEYVIFNYKKEILTYELSKNLILLDEDLKDRFISVTKKQYYEPVYLLICQNHYNYDEYLKYKKDKRYISVGNSIENDIFVNDILLEETHMLIDTYNKSIINSNNIKTYVNDKISLTYTSTSIIKLLNLKLIITNDFIMVNNCLNIYVKLDKLNKIKNNIVIKDKTIIKKSFRNYQNFIFNEYDILKPLPIYNINQTPLIFSIGPALTMSLASLLSGLFSIYNSYNQGRDIKDSISMLILPIVMLISTLLWNPLQRLFDNKKRKKYELLRVKEYKENINIIKEKMILEHMNYRIFIEDNYLSPSKINDSILANNKLVYQKQNKDKDFLNIYIGKGDIYSKSIINNKHELDINLINIFDKFYEEIKIIKNVGIVINLKKIKHIAIVKDKRDEDLYYKYLLLQLLTYYSYEELNIAILCNENWINKNLNILNINNLYNNYTSFRYIATKQKEVLAINKNYDEKPIIIFIEKKELYKYINIENHYTITLCNEIDEIPRYCKEYIIVKEYKGIYINEHNKLQKFTINDLTELNFDDCLYKLTNIDVSNKENKISNNLSLFDLLNIKSIDELNINNNWNKNKNLKSINCILGKTYNNLDIEIDISENGNGPHGLIAGMTGSGKSELIISLLISLCTKYHPNYFQVVIIDYKGGGIIQSLNNQSYKLPHLVGSLSNLDSNELRRCLVSFNQESIKRQKLFKKMSSKYNIPNINIDIYQRYCEIDNNFEMVSHLLIVVDEFAELKKHEYEFMSELISISRIGRSLGIHLILSTQKPSGVVDEQIWSNCRYKICLKVQNKQDSYEMLHKNDATTLKNPGEFFLMYDDILERGQCGWANEIENKKDYNKIQILDLTLDVIKESTNKSYSNKTQLVAIMEKINKESKGISVNSLWLSNIEKVTFDMFDNDKYYLGLIDNYYHRTYDEFIYLNKHIVTYSLDTSEKRKFVNVILFSILRNTTKLKTEVYVIDGLNSDLEIFYKSSIVIDILKQGNFEKIINLFKKCNKIIKNNLNQKEIYIIINNVPQFKEQYEEIYDMYKLILLEGNEHNIHLILFTTTFNTLHYQEQALIHQKVSLLNINKNELISIFELNQKIFQNKKGYGLIKKENILEFKYCDISTNEINTMIENHNMIYGSEKLYKLPYIPENIYLNDYKDSKNIFGINIETYEWVCVTDKIVLCGLYTDLIEKYSNLYNIKAIQTENINFYIKQNYSILWVGPGYLRQYFIPVEYKNDLNENEAIFFRRGKISKIRLAQ